MPTKLVLTRLMMDGGTLYRSQFATHHLTLGDRKGSPYCFTIASSMIQESTIERVLTRLESGEDDFALEIQDFAHEQPALMTYLTDEENDIFTEAEREVLLFGAIVIFQAVTDERVAPESVNSTAIGQAEEANYALVGDGKGKFRERITPLFEQSPEEELLAFAEDLLMGGEEDDQISNEAREPLFITLKTVVDVLG
ncbi:MAG: hypothetical protein AAF597_15230 [Bacteroidota bacterium]